MALNNTIERGELPKERKHVIPMLASDLDVTANYHRTAGASISSLVISD